MREPVVAGLFYPGEAGALRRAVTGLLRGAKAAPCRPKALIAPHAGYAYSGPVAASAYKTLEGRSDGVNRVVNRVVLLGPSHRVGFSGLALSSAGLYRTPLGDVPLDGPSYEVLRGLPGVTVLDAAHAREHSLEVHLPFLQLTLGSFSLVPIVVGEADANDVARVLNAAWGGDETLAVVSTDLSHYLGYDEAVRRDRATADAILACDGSRIGPEDACGVYPLRGLLRLVRERGVRVTELDVRNSGDTAGGRDRVVGYGAWVVEE